ncbi:hypothetical protein [Antarctobacter jejuensis]|uniref:hypothetical protein n=1 Tax=Antarctobacter jejuensis TaxID=1439938 RepID=UPI003FD5D587
MMRILTLMLALCLPATAQADLSLSDLVGTWAGEGSYYERPTKTRMKCRISFAGDDAQVRLTGKCGSSLGAHDLSLDFIRDGSSKVIVRAAPGAKNDESKIERMEGQLSGNFLIAEGTGGTETAKFQLESKRDGSIVFVTQREDGTFFAQSVVTLRRR